MERFLSISGMFGRRPVHRVSVELYRETACLTVGVSRCVWCRWVGAMLFGHVDVVREESAIECGAADSENLSGLCPVPMSLLECLEQLRFWFCVVRILGG